MELRTFYWDAAARTGAPSLLDRLRRKKPDFQVGNAGDLFNRDLISFLYDAQAVNSDEPSRLLLVGSVAHRAAGGDFVCGIGSKGAPIAPPSAARLDIRGVRGPITLQAFRDAGHDVSNVKFEFDPGLLVASVYSDLLSIEVVPNRVIFIPHYRDRKYHARARGVTVIDIDCDPRTLVAEILQAEFIYSSSLHGIVFAHALGRPCVLVEPVNGEADIKYRDYFASVGLAWRAPLGLDSAMRALKRSSPLDLRVDLSSFAGPSIDELQAAGVLR